MISVLFIGIAIMFLCLATASYIVRSSIKKPHSKIIEVIKREISNEKLGAMGWASSTTYLYKTVNHHFWFEIAGFLVAAFAAIVEFLLTR